MPITQLTTAERTWYDYLRSKIAYKAHLDEFNHAARIYKIMSASFADETSFFNCPQADEPDREVAATNISESLDTLKNLIDRIGKLTVELGPVISNYQAASRAVADLGDLGGLDDLGVSGVEASSISHDHPLEFNSDADCTLPRRKGSLKE
ncbi:uncharacterized protein I303_107220 [Kwoniella dejecticola CBS 10117]|uniref:Uncharacterized protein n=1 Tax=Kwoniella dejecticola CBS 10117 TaxID=1296121 RepID=A0A1A5ZZ26_9TREE|nr:uncharacterized protein I303_06621 [Kwoniella dejecticola CBS 10117]OBR83062.1 hypothetical protein I303_06621 [Kwoniella dejecticola CBS 10117]